LYVTAMTLLVYSLDQWKERRLDFLKRLIVMAHARKLSSSTTTKLSDCSPAEYSVYHPTLLFFALVDQLHIALKKPLGSRKDWAQGLLDFIRKNDEALQKLSDKVLEHYQENLMPCESFFELCDVQGLMLDPETYITQCLSLVPK